MKINDITPNSQILRTMALQQFEIRKANLLGYINSLTQANVIVNNINNDDDSHVTYAYGLHSIGGTLRKISHETEKIGIKEEIGPYLPHDKHLEIENICKENMKMILDCYVKSIKSKEIERLHLISIPLRCFVVSFPI